MNGLGERIKYARKKGKITQDNLAIILDLQSGVSISNYEKEQREPTISTVLKIAEVCNVDVTWLLTGQGSPTGGDSTASENADNNTKSQHSGHINQTCISDDELVIINKLRLVPESIPLINQLLDGKILIRGAIDKFSNSSYSATPDVSE